MANKIILVPVKGKKGTYKIVVKSNDSNNQKIDYTNILESINKPIPKDIKEKINSLITKT